MKTKFRKIFYVTCFLLSILLFITPIQAFYEDEKKAFSHKNITDEAILSSNSLVLSNADFEYSVTDEEVTITRYIGNATEVEVPSSIDGKVVSAERCIHINCSGFCACADL